MKKESISESNSQKQKIKALDEIGDEELSKSFDQIFNKSVVIFLKKMCR